jgi:hypothetical protein
MTEKGKGKGPYVAAVEFEVSQFSATKKDDEDEDEVEEIVVPSSQPSDDYGSSLHLDSDAIAHLDEIESRLCRNSTDPFIAAVYQRRGVFSASAAPRVPVPDSTAVTQSNSVSSASAAPRAPVPNSTAITQSSGVSRTTRSTLQSQTAPLPRPRPVNNRTPYLKLIPNARWPYYVIFTGPHAGIYSAW